MTEDELLGFLKEGLSLDVETNSVYTGGMGGDLYEDCTTLKLKLFEETISEVSIS